MDSMIRYGPCKVPCAGLAIVGLVRGVVRRAELPERRHSSWALVELIEAATRSGMAEPALGALARLTEMTSASRHNGPPGSHRCGRGHALDTGGEDLR